MSIRDETERIPVNLVARGRVPAGNRFRQQRIVIYSHAAPLQRLPDRRSVLDAALRPERIQSTRDAEHRLRSDISLVDLAVVADGANGPRCPVRRQAQLL